MRRSELVFGNSKCITEAQYLLTVEKFLQHLYNQTSQGSIYYDFSFLRLHL